MNRRALGLVTLVVAALVATVGSGAVSSISTDRGVDVAVAGDDTGYLAIQTNGQTFDCADNSARVPLLRVENRFPASTVEHIAGVALDVSGHSASEQSIVVDSVDGTWESTDRAGTVAANVTCKQSGTERVSLDVAVRTDRGVSVTFTRHLAVSCTLGNETQISIGDW